MLATADLLLRAREYRQNALPQGGPANALSHDDELHLVQMKFNIVDRLVRDSGVSFDDHQVFSVATTNAIAAAAEELEKDPLLEAIFVDFAASVELACRSRISDVQLSQLSRALLRAADLYFDSRYYVHAASCYSQAQRGFRKLDSFDEMQKAEYRLRLSTWRSRRSTSNLLRGFWSNLLFGFGFRPYRVLWAVLAVIVLFGVAYLGLIPAADPATALFMSLYGYFGVLGKSDLIEMPVWVRSLVVVESFLALVLNSTLVALLAKRWFRL